MRNVFKVTIATAFVVMAGTEMAHAAFIPAFLGGLLSSFGAIGAGGALWSLGGFGAIGAFNAGFGLGAFLTTPVGNMVKC